jgi:hypothetical protein
MVVRRPDLNDRSDEREQKWQDDNELNQRLPALVVCTRCAR